MSYAAEEIASQPRTWLQAADLAADSAVRAALPQPEERVAVVGCGTSFYVAQACAALREHSGAGETDAFAASQFPRHRTYDRVVALTRSGTTTEVIELLRDLPRSLQTTVVTTDPGHPVISAATHSVIMDFADERSVVQTRFATSIVALWREVFDAGLGAAVTDARTVVDGEVDPELTGRAQFTFLGSGWTVGLAQEAALKLRETSQSWAEAYPAMEFRHGPISVVDERSAVVALTPLPPGLGAEVRRTGALLVDPGIDPLAQLVAAQRLAVAIAERKGLDPDRPRHLTRSIILSATG